MFRKVIKAAFPRRAFSSNTSFFARPNFSLTRRFIFGSTIGASLVIDDPKTNKITFLNSLENTNIHYQKVLTDLKFTKEQAGAIYEFSQIFDYVHNGMGQHYDFEFSHNFNGFDRYQTLQKLSQFFATENFKTSFDVTYYSPTGFDNENITETTNYSKFPSGRALQERHETVLKVAKILNVAVDADIQKYDENIVKVARHIESAIKPNFPKLRESYNKVSAVAEDEKEGAELMRYRKRL